MGLLISRSIIKVQNGFITFCNNSNIGMTFYFTFITIKRDNQYESRTNSVRC
jgi:K+-sensing histidine kinase KdpD